MVVLASVIALPLAWWGLEQWLNGFALRVEINTINIALPFAVALALAFLSVGIQTWRVAKRSPVNSLRSGL
jgi:putative ABC transport system permease protein